MGNASRILVAAAITAGLTIATSAFAEYPEKPVTVIVPYAPGGATDIVARVFAEELRKDLGQSFVVENKPGANGLIALEELVKAQPDGYTLMVGNVSTNAITPFLYKDKLSFDYKEKVEAVASLAKIPNFVAVAVKGFETTTLEEFIAEAKSRDGGLLYTSAGVGSYPHYDMLVLADKAGFKATHIPSKDGASGMLIDLVNGDAQAAFVNVASSSGLVNEGKIRALATITDERLPAFPNVPTLKELGYEGVGTYNWQGVFAPKGLPEEVSAKLIAAFNKALEAESVKAAFEKSAIISDVSPDAASAKAWLESEMELWEDLVGKYDLKD